MSEKTIRPKKGKVIKYKLFNDNTYHTGKVMDVGKVSGNQKFLCWIKDSNGFKSVIDFLEEVEKWNYIKVRFADNINVNTYTIREIA